MRISAALYVALLLGLVNIDIILAQSMDTAFTYQGRLKQDGSPIDQTCDFQFGLWNDPNTGVQVGVPVVKDNIYVIGGLFTVQLDFGAATFNGEQRWLEIAVRYPHDPTDTAPFITLSPRQSITAAPYALHTRGLYVDATGKLGIGTLNPSSKLSVSDNTALEYAVSFDQSTSTGHTLKLTMDGPSPMSNLIYADPGGIGNLFVVTGDGKVGVGTHRPSVKLDVYGDINTTTQFKIGGYPVLSSPNFDSLFVGLGAGTNNSSGYYNTFLGNNSGYSNTTGHSNTFLGDRAGYFTNTGFGNVFLGN